MNTRAQAMQMLSRVAPRWRGVRRGSALILVLIMTLSLAGLAISAIYLSSSAGLLTRYYDRERDYRFAAEGALALGKSRVNRDTLLGLPDDTALKIITAGTLTDAGGAAVPRVKVNLFGAYTGDTIGRYGQYVTLLASAFDSGGTRHVRRLDLTGESFSRYGLFVNFFGALCFGTSEYIRGRAHSNTAWQSCAGAPGPDYYDTVSAVTTVSGTAVYHGLPTKPGSAVIPYPTVAKLAALPGYATAGNLNITPVSGSFVASANGGGVNMSGRQDALNAVRGTRIRFKPIDVGNDGQVDEQDGMMMVFDLAAGIDTSSLRADLVESGTQPPTNIVMLNQCGLLITNAAGKKEFFPVARFRELWVRVKVRNAVSPAVTTPDTAAMGAGTAASYNKILSYGPGVSRCFPAGSPYLMLTERMVTGACVPTTVLVAAVWGWGATAAACPAGTQYGGQDTTFTPVVTRCAITQAATTGACTNQVALGSWRAWTGAALPAISATLIQGVEVPFLWPLFKPYNLTSKGVIYSSGRLYVSDTLRGNVTLYVSGNLIEIDDVQYDKNPMVIANICRNFLGMIARDSVMIADNSMNRPRPDPGGTMRFLGPNINMEIHAVQMSILGTVGVESYNTGPVTAVANLCNGVGTASSGGCINTVGGVIMQNLSAVYSGANTGFRTNRSVDPCQLTNRKPPFFPMTGRYLDNKYYEIDPVNVDSWTEVKGFYARLRGRSAP